MKYVTKSKINSMGDTESHVQMDAQSHLLATLPPDFSLVVHQLLNVMPSAQALQIATSIHPSKREAIQLLFDLILDDSDSLPF